MKKLVSLIAVVCILLVYCSVKGEEPMKYRRSSLHMILVEMDDITTEGVVLNAYNNMPFPDKYNDHEIDEVLFNPKEWTLTEADLAEGVQKNKKSFIGKFLKKQATSIIPDLDGENAKELKEKIDKYLKEKKVGNKLVAKWFDRTSEGVFDTKLLQERGLYDAKSIEVKLAEGTARGSATLEDAGEELIKNTFVVVNRLKYVKNKIIGDAIKIAAMKLPSIARLAAMTAAEEFMTDGYSVWTKSFLYRLDWNDSIANTFYTEYWMDESNKSPERKEAFDKSDLFTLTYVGKQSALTMITKSLGEAFNIKNVQVRDSTDLIAEAAVRTVDKVYAKLQKKYDVFKPKVPLLSVEPLTAKIGKKEGLKGGEKFEVMELRINKKTGKTEYVKKGTIKVVKNKVWDNRFVLTGGEKEEVTAKEEQFTIFEGKGKFYPGMLIQQIK